MVEILVCVKLVYDLENVIAQEWKVAEDGQSIPIESAGKIMNTCDANALELALRVQDRLTQDKVRITVLTAGDEACRKMLTTARAVGAQRCVRIPPTGAGGGYTSRPTARALCDAIRLLGPFDLLLFGHSAGEYDVGQTGFQVAELLGLPVLDQAVEIQALEEDGFLVEHLLDEGTARCEVRSPAVVTVDTPPEVCLRSPTLKAMMAASRCQEEVLELPEQPEQTPGKRQNRLWIPESGRDCRLLDPQRPQEAAQLIAQLLRRGGDGP
jgi:electron transfer flavoprotein alpha/beta subunit